MKNYIQIIIGIFLFSSCSQISKNVENTFIEVNNKLIDSIGIINSDTQNLFNSINSNRIKKWQGENSAAIFYSINSHNELIDSVQNLIISNSKSTSDKVAITKLLIEEKFAKKIQESSIETKKSILGSTVNLKISEDDLNLISPGTKDEYANESWDVNMFKQLPAFATIPILKKWKLENMKCQEMLLNQIKNELEKENQR